MRPKKIEKSKTKIVLTIVHIPKTHPGKKISAPKISAAYSNDANIFFQETNVCS